MKRTLIFTLSTGLLLGLSAHGEDDGLLEAGILGPIISDSEITDSADPFSEEDPGMAFDHWEPEEEDPIDAEQPSSPVPSSREVILPEVIRERPANGPAPTDPTIAPVYHFDGELAQEAITTIARDLPQPVVIEIATRMAVSGDYTGQIPVEALQNLVKEAGLQLGVYRDTIYVFEAGTASRIAQMIIRDKDEGERLELAKKQEQISPAVEPQKVKAVNTSETIEKNPLVSKAIAQELKKLRQKREKLLDRRNRI